jgi:hypothetical protein
MSSVEFFKHGSLTISLNGIRSVIEVRQNPAGGRPRADAGGVVYEDGATIDVSLDFAVALSKHLMRSKDA